jgi:hypothetical protein
MLHLSTVFENKGLRRALRSMKEEITGALKKLHCKELHNVYSSPNIVRMIKSKCMRMTGQVTHMD